MKFLPLLVFFALSMVVRADCFAFGPYSGGETLTICDADAIILDCASGDSLEYGYYCPNTVAVDESTIESGYFLSYDELYYYNDFLVTVDEWDDCDNYLGQITFFEEDAGPAE